MEPLQPTVRQGVAQLKDFITNTGRQVLYHSATREAQFGLYKQRQRGPSPGLTWTPSSQGP